MSNHYQELEVKFYIAEPAKLLTKLKALDAVLVQPRTFERNLRFDTPSNQLTRARRVLRLRQDTETRLTYKGPAKAREGLLAREEIEFIASDFQKAKAFLEALGYQVRLIYEKYRSVYQYQGAEISVDELPFGNFIEIEVEDPELIKSISRQLRLNWEAHIPISYASLFVVVKRNLHLTFRDLTFENFAHINVSFSDLEVLPADK